VYIPKGLVEIHNYLSDTLAGHVAAHRMLSLVPQMGLGWERRIDSKKKKKDGAGLA